MRVCACPSFAAGNQQVWSLNPDVQMAFSTLSITSAAASLKARRMHLSRLCCFVLTTEAVTASSPLAVSAEGLAASPSTRPPSNTVTVLDALVSLEPPSSSADCYRQNVAGEATARGVRVLNLTITKLAGAWSMSYESGTDMKPNLQVTASTCEV